MKPIIDPRRGDLEDDASSTKRRALLSLAGSLLSEISLPKLAMAWILLLVVVRAGVQQVHPRPLGERFQVRGYLRRRTAR